MVMGKKADIAWDKILKWILLLALLIFVLIFFAGLGDYMKELIYGFFGFMG